ncbi:hypothetical protein ABTX15_22520 [Micromonospora sp. NPDC094482]|uniref:hypothetical protein n=1 Tax=Micromonospora sp. NPDC094482 TaxID=3155081 RepID=UPI003317B075
MLGGKTGFTNLPRQTFVGVAERDGRRLAVTLLGAETAPLGSLGEAIAPLDWGIALPRDTSVGRLVEPGGAKSSLALMAGIGEDAIILLMALIVASPRRRACRYVPQDSQTKVTGGFGKGRPALTTLGASRRSGQPPVSTASRRAWG